MAQCLVLGSNGFIGSYLVDALVKKGHAVRCFDRYKSDAKHSQDDLGPRIEIFHGDFFSDASLATALKGVEYVFHFISTTNPYLSEKDPQLDVETNVLHTIKLLQLCVESRIKRVIFPSTSAIYGDQPESKNGLSEETQTHPFSPYAIGKLTIENYLHYFKKKHGLNSLILRISNPYGPRQNTLNGQGVIGTFLEHAKNNEPITMYGDGSMMRDYIYVEDLAQIIASIFDKETKFHLYNIGSGRGTTVKKIAEIVEKVTGKKLERKHVPAPLSFVKNIVLDTTRITSEIPRERETPLQEGVSKTWELMK